jgi:hypothetical protein
MLWRKFSWRRLLLRTVLTDEIWVQDALLSFELIEKPYECYHVIALPINITFILGGIPLFLRYIGCKLIILTMGKGFIKFEAGLFTDRVARLPIASNRSRS